MKKLLTLILVFSVHSACAQTSAAIISIDFVKILNGHRPEALYYYKNNWKILRDSAIKKDYIRSYKLLETNIDSAADYNLILVTEYADSVQFNLREFHFQEIMNSRRNKELVLLNNIKPGEFRLVVNSNDSQVLFESFCK